MGSAVFLEQVSVPSFPGWRACGRGCSHLDCCQEITEMLSSDHRAVLRALHGSLVHARALLASPLLTPDETSIHVAPMIMKAWTDQAIWYVGKNNNVKLSV